ncbi:hypothetical protein DF048_03725 [Burkholderia seminalis]|nr:hypothetical protein DF032_06225 [Burkholderia seminalis]RQS99735.1 hypothetical protein DF048_03725 [Burkholderia seminalis]
MQRLTVTRDFDFPQPAHFLRLTNIGSVLNNRLRNRKKRFFDTRENWGRAMGFRGRMAKNHNHNQSTGPEIRKP